MHPKGIIYEAGRSGTHGERILLLSWFVRVAYHLLRGVGGGFIALAVLIFSFSFGPVLSQEISYGLKSANLINKKDFTLESAGTEETLEVQRQAKDLKVNSYFSVVIPKIEASANIVVNVDAADKDSYLSALQRGVAHAKGTYFPGQNGRIFLFSHSTDSPLNFARYNAVFYLLGKLKVGDGIIVFFADKRYDYKVSEVLNASVNETSWLEPKYGEEELVLMTCDPPGTTWRRLLVVARPDKPK